MKQRVSPRHVSRRDVLRATLGVAGSIAGLPLLVSCAATADVAQPQPSLLSEGQPAATPVPFSQHVGGVSPDEIVLGMSAAFAGSSKGLGIELYRGAMAYFEHINQMGGVHGRKIVVKAYNDGYNPTPAIDNTINLVEQDDVFLVFNYVGTPTVTRILPLLRRYNDKHMYLFFPFTGAQPQREAPYEDVVFNLRASYRQETAGLVDNLARVGRQRIAVFYQADAYGRSGWDGVRRALGKRDLSMVGEATYRRGTPFTASMREQVTILREANPDVIIAIGAYAACAALIRDARDAGWDVPIANVSFVGSESLLKLLQEAGSQANTDYTRQLINSQVVPSYEDLALPAVVEYRELMERYQPMPAPELLEEQYTPLPQSFVSFEGFLNAKVLVETLKRMGSRPERARLKQTVELMHDLDVGVNTSVSFGPTKHQGLDTVYYTTVTNGRFLPIVDWGVWSA